MIGTLDTRVALAIAAIAIIVPTIVVVVKVLHHKSENATLTSAVNASLQINISKNESTQKSPEELSQPSEYNESYPPEEFPEYIENETAESETETYLGSCVKIVRVYFEGGASYSEYGEYEYAYPYPEYGYEYGQTESQNVSAKAELSKNSQIKLFVEVKNECEETQNITVWLKLAKELGVTRNNITFSSILPGGSRIASFEIIANENTPLGDYVIFVYAKGESTETVSSKAILRVVEREEVFLKIVKVWFSKISNTTTENETEGYYEYEEYEEESTTATGSVVQGESIWLNVEVKNLINEKQSVDIELSIPQGISADSTKKSLEIEEYGSKVFKFTLSTTASTIPGTYTIKITASSEKATVISYAYLKVSEASVTKTVEITSVTFDPPEIHKSEVSILSIEVKNLADTPQIISINLFTNAKLWIDKTFKATDKVEAKGTRIIQFAVTTLEDTLPGTYAIKAIATNELGDYDEKFAEITIKPSEAAPAPGEEPMTVSLRVDPEEICIASEECTQNTTILDVEVINKATINFTAEVYIDISNLLLIDSTHKTSDTIKPGGSRIVPFNITSTASTYPGTYIINARVYGILAPAFTLNASKNTNVTPPENVVNWGYDVYHFDTSYILNISTPYNETTNITLPTGVTSYHYGTEDIEGITYHFLLNDTNAALYIDTDKNFTDALGPFFINDLVIFGQRVYNYTGVASDRTWFTLQRLFIVLLDRDNAQIYVDDDTNFAETNERGEAMLGPLNVMNVITIEGRNYWIKSIDTKTNIITLQQCYYANKATALNVVRQLEEETAT